MRGTRATLPTPAPSLGALGAGGWSVARVPLVVRHPDHGLGRLEGAGLHVRAGELAPETARALLGDDLEDFHRGRETDQRRLGLRARAGPPPSSRAMNASSGVAGRGIICTQPRAPHPMDT